MYGIGETMDGRRSSIDRRALMFPVCSGCLDLVSVAMQMVAVATSYWAHFRREIYPNQVDLLNTVEPVALTKTDPLYEEGHYGLWSVCLTGFGGRRLEVEDCSANIVHFHPSSWRVFTGIIATINIVLSLIFMATIPFQFRHLKSGRPVYCKYKTLTRIKMVLAIVGALCGVIAAVLFGIHSHHKHYKEPKGWSFGLQIIVIIVQVFLIICSSAENVWATRIDEARPKPQFLFTVSSSPSFQLPNGEVNATTGTTTTTTTTKKKKKKKRKSTNEQLTEVVTVHDLSRDNPIFVDSENEDVHANRSSLPSQQHNSSRFVVVKVADMYTNSGQVDSAYDNLGYVANESDQMDSLEPSNGPQSVRVTNM